MSYIHRIKQKNLDFPIENLVICKNHQEILNFDQSLRDLEIFPSETLIIEFSSSEQKDSSQSILFSSHFKDISEEESLILFKNSKKIGKITTESTNDGASLWKTAISSSKYFPKNIEKHEDLSSLIFPNEFFIESSPVLQLIPSTVDNGQSVILDSDESFKCESKLPHSIHRHPCDFFRDLQGPFSALNNYKSWGSFH